MMLGIGLLATACGSSATASGSLPSPALASKAAALVSNSVTFPFTLPIAKAMAGIKSSPRLPLLAPSAGGLSVLGERQDGRDNYEVDIRTATGLILGFGGQAYSSLQAAQSTVQNLAIVVPGRGRSDPLGPGVVAHAYSTQDLITWSEGRWILEVSASPGAPDMPVLQSEAVRLASVVSHRVLPTNAAVGIVDWSLGGNGQGSVAITWVVGRDNYFVNERHGGALAEPVAVAASMRLYLDS
ncbi:MAG: hypothetical protein M0Z53_02925 [Thermaerobacter sp.]|nr:hypothetical protein [Thermaerobacter sp.]